MEYRIRSSANAEHSAALCEVVSGLDIEPLTIIYFSANEHFEYYAAALKERYPDAEIYGASSQRVYVGSGGKNKTLTLLAVDKDFESYGGVIEEIDRFPDKYAYRIKECASRLSSTENCVCLEFTTAFCFGEELVLDTLNKVLSPLGIPIAGGTTDVKGNAEDNLVSYNGKVYDCACVFMLIHNKGGKIGIYRENIFSPTQNRLLATSVDVNNRIVHQFNDRPAADVLAEALNVTVGELSGHLSEHPLGRERGDNVYIVLGKEVLDNGGVSFFARIYGSTKLLVLKPDDFDTSTDRTVEVIRRDIPHPRMGIIINCVDRTDMFTKAGFMDKFLSKYDDLLQGNYLCFSAMGEQMHNVHLNQTMVAIIFE